jgi:hypothetical protein
MENDTLSDDKSTEAEDSSTTATDEKDTKAAPSADKKDERTLADVIKDAAAKSVADSSSDKEEEKEESTETVDKTGPDGTKEDESDEKEAESQDEKVEVPVEEKDKALPFHKHPRFQEVIKERASFKQKVDELTPVAQRAQAIDDYCQKHGVTNEEFNSAVEMAALLRTNPSKGLETLRGYVEALEVSMGNKLPTDLQNEVDAGTLSLERAKELTAARVKSQGLEHTSKRTEAQIAQERQANITSAVNDWDKQKRTSDVAYDKKYPLIEKAFIAACSLTPPRTPQEAIQLAEKAYTEVNTALGTLTPKPPKRKVLQTNGSVAKGVISIEPGMSLRQALPLIAKKVVAEHKG